MPCHQKLQVERNSRDARTQPCLQSRQLQTLNAQQLLVMSCQVHDALANESNASGCALSQFCICILCASGQYMYLKICPHISLTQIILLPFQFQEQSTASYSGPCCIRHNAAKHATCSPPAHAKTLAKEWTASMAWVLLSSQSVHLYLPHRTSCVSPSNHP